MTQPVQEPTPQRSDSNLSWGERQLRRRPGPHISPGLPYSMIEWAPDEADYFSASSGVQYEFNDLAAVTDFTWGVVSASGVDVFFPQMNVGSIDWVDTGSSAQAFMVAQATVQWEDTFSEQVVTWVFMGQSGTGSGDGPQLVPSISNGSVAGYRSSDTQMYVGLESSYAYGYFEQDSGVDRNLVYASVSVFRVDTADGATFYP